MCVVINSKCEIKVSIILNPNGRVICEYLLTRGCITI